MWQSLMFSSLRINVDSVIALIPLILSLPKVGVFPYKFYEIKIKF